MGIVKKGLTVAVRKPAETTKPAAKPAVSSDKSSPASGTSKAGGKPSKGAGKGSGKKGGDRPNTKSAAKGKGKSSGGKSSTKGSGKSDGKGKGKGKGGKGKKGSRGKGDTRNASDSDSDDEDESKQEKTVKIKTPALPADDESATKKKKIKPGSFESFGLHPILNRAIMKLGYKMPTPIQRKCIPLVMGGRDVIGMARTGSGKTAAFLLPTLHKLELTHSTTVGVRALVLSPTRELAMQSSKACKQLNANGGDLRICLLVGGQAMEAQFDRLAQNPDVVFATPGRLVHHMVEAELSLARVETLIFDEADRLFELGFAEQIHKIMEACPQSRQCLLFSATLPSQVFQFSRLGMRDPEVVRLDVETSLSENLELEFLYVRKEEKIAAALHLLRRHLTADFRADARSSSSRTPAIKNGGAANDLELEQLRAGSKGTIAGKKGKGKGKKGSNTLAGSTAQSSSSKERGVVFFVATRHHVEFFASLFKRAGGGIKNVCVVYGNMDQAARNEQVSKFHKHRGVLITTDVAARGIDIPLLDSVINYDFPASAKLFVHRAGRTARAGEQGLCSSLVGKDDLPYCMELLLFLGRKVKLPTDQVLSPEQAEEAKGQEGDESKVQEQACGNDAAKEQSTTVSSNDGMLGAVPDLTLEVEELARLFAANDPGNDLVTLSKSMTASYIQYFKTRPPASKQSVRRAKELLADIGGPQKMQCLIHPSYDQTAKENGKSNASASQSGPNAEASKNSNQPAEVGDLVRSFLKHAVGQSGKKKEKQAEEKDGIDTPAAENKQPQAPITATSSYVQNLRAGIREYRPSQVCAKKQAAYSAISTDAIANMKNVLEEKRAFQEGCVKVRQSMLQKNMEDDQEEKTALKRNSNKRSKNDGDGTTASDAGEEANGIKKLSKAERKQLKRQRTESAAPRKQQNSKPSSTAAAAEEDAKQIASTYMDDDDSDADDWNIEVAEYNQSEHQIPATKSTSSSSTSARSKNTTSHQIATSSKIHAQTPKIPRALPTATNKAADVGEDIFSRAEQGFRDEQFFLSTDRTIEEDAKDRGLDLDRYELNIMGDDGKELQKQQFVRRWDAKKKKYLQVKIGADGKAIREKNRTNEAGKKVSGDAKRTDAYAKWSKTQKQRIQQVGELENSNAALSFLASKKNGTATDTVDDDAGDASGAVEFDEDGKAVTKKPIVPFFGEVDSKYLTNKQKRRLAKQEKQSANPVSHGKAGGPITRTAADIKKLRKRQDDMKMKQDKSYRQKRLATIKAAYWERQEEKIRSKQARPRSFAIWSGGKKDMTKKQEKKKQGKRRGPVPL
ncbi:unnamed protein product [Amoebophrya sp. A120]|nr:unnamed protein product [Amoebophrya sp. A120]|eukprot:GSA120T00011429001.1